MTEGRAFDDVVAVNVHPSSPHPRRDQRGRSSRHAALTGCIGNSSTRIGRKPTWRRLCFASPMAKTPWAASSTSGPKGRIWSRSSISTTRRAAVPGLVADSLGSAQPLERAAGLRVVDPYHLVVFKLYAGGAKSALDILELLDRNPNLDLERLRKLCAGYDLDTALTRVLGLAGENLRAPAVMGGQPVGLAWSR